MNLHEPLDFRQNIVEDIVRKTLEHTLLGDKWVTVSKRFGTG